jgi:hypothetical protein
VPPLRDWEFDELRRRQALALVDHMFRVEGRAAEGARGILSALSAMAEDAIGDDVATHNAFMGVRLRRNDPRIKKPARRRARWPSPCRLAHRRRALRGHRFGG